MLKEIKDKEVIIGLILIIILGSIALTLLVRREVKSRQIAPETAVEESMEIPEETSQAFEIEETSIIVEETAVEGMEDTEETEISLANVQVVTEKNSQDLAKKESKKVGLYDVLGDEKYTSATLTERKQEDNQLKELYEYWDAYKLDAVADLVRLERLQKVSEELEGKNKFYYYGSVDRLGRPSGKGLAVYEDNTYYFGEWKDGLRHGKGMWLEVAIYNEENQEENLGLVEHSYNGEWSKDLPNGQGQEHFSYDYNVLNYESIKDIKCVSNVIGGFKDGYYNGEMYVMTVDASGNTKDWGGSCENGVWDVIYHGSSTDSVWESYEVDQNGQHEYHYLFPKENSNYGIIGLKK